MNADSLANTLPEEWIPFIPASGCICSNIGHAGQSSNIAPETGDRVLSVMDSLLSWINKAWPQRDRAFSESLYRGAIETSPDGFWIVGDGGRLIDVNDAYCRLSGYSRDELLSMYISDLEAMEAPEETAAHIKLILEQGHDRFETLHRRKDGTIWPVEVTTTYSANSRCFFVFCRDLTAIKLLEERRQRAEEEIRHMAFYDALTNLPNRRMLLDRLVMALASSSRSQHLGAVIFMDLDGFKRLNDTAGHQAGDLLLIEVGRRLQEITRAEDTVARLAGDEFVVMIEGLPQDIRLAEEIISGIGEKMRRIIAQPYQIANQPQRITPSLGIALFGLKKVTAEEILKLADQAMYQAKAQGGNGVHLIR